MGIVRLFILFVLFSISVLASGIYGAGANGNLYLINNLSTGNVTLLGAMGTVMYDIAEFGNSLYGIDSNSNLYSISETTGAATEIGATGQAFNALTFNSQGVLYAAGINTTKMYTINLRTGAATAVPGETNATAYNSAGDLQFVGNTLYLTTGTGGVSQLDTVNLATGALTKFPNTTGYTDVYGLLYSGGILYGFTAGGTSGNKIISLNTTTGVGTMVVNAFSVAFDGTTSDAAPEPATIGLVATVLLIIATIGSRWKRKDGSGSDQADPHRRDA
jgi:hypothetical protein